MLVLIILQKRERHSSQCRMVSDGNTWLRSDLLFIAPLSSIIVTTTKVVLLATYAVRRLWFDVRRRCLANASNIGWRLAVILFIYL